jgi:hypothetical protein
MGEGIEPNKVDLSRNDIEIIVITTDGIHGSPKEVLSQIVRGIHSEYDLTHRLITLSALLGGHDNGTVIALHSDKSTPETDGGQGLILTLLSANDRLEVWIPILGEEARQERPNSAAAKEDSVRNSQTRDLTPQSPPTRLDRVNTKKKRKGRSLPASDTSESSGEEQSLPLDDSTTNSILDVKFPPSK